MQRIKVGLIFTALLLAAAALVQQRAVAQSMSAEEQGTQIYELRIYHTNPGLLPNLHERFRDHTNRIFAKHGMRVVGFWTPTDRDNELIYILSYPSREAREASWEAFRADPEWIQVRDASHEKAGGVIVAKVDSTIMTPTDYSPMR